MSRFSSDRIQALQLDSWRRCICPPRRFRSCDSTASRWLSLPVSIELFRCFLSAGSAGSAGSKPQTLQAAVRTVPARALWLEVLRRTWDATRCASKVRSQMTDGPHGYLRSDTNDTMLTRSDIRFRMVSPQRSLEALHTFCIIAIAGCFLAICGDLW